VIVRATSHMINATKILNIVLLSLAVSVCEADFLQKSLDLFAKNYWNEDIFKYEPTNLKFDISLPMYVAVHEQTSLSLAIHLSAVKGLNDAPITKKIKDSRVRKFRVQIKEFNHPNLKLPIPSMRKIDARLAVPSSKLEAGYLVRLSIPLKFPEGKKLINGAAYFVDIWVKGTRKGSSGIHLLIIYNKKHKIIDHGIYRVFDEWG